MFTIKVKPLDLLDRITAEPYAPEFVDCASILEESPLQISNLGSVVSKKINNSIRGVTGQLDVPGSTVPMFRPADIADGVARIETAPKLTNEFEELHEKSRVYPGDIVLGIAGSVGTLGRVQKGIRFGNINGSSARLAFASDELSGYVLAFLLSKYGQANLLRFGVGSVQKHLNLEDIPKVEIRLTDPPAQKYIGNKVRQAEQLRAWAKRLEVSVNRFHSQFIPTQEKLNFNKKTRKVSVARLTERLDAHFYPGVVEEYLNAHPGKFESVKFLTSATYNGQTQPEISEDLCEQITVAHLSASFVKGQPRKVAPPSKNDKYVKPHDILMCNAAHNKSYIGRELTYVHTDKKLLPSTEVMTIRVNRSLVPASYVRTYLLSRLGYVKIQSTIRGITAHSYPDDVELLDIYIPEVESNLEQKWFKQDDLLVLAGFAVEFAQKLTSSAKNLVESLIEGQLTEQQLIQAQQALEDGDNTLDQAILSKLSTEGYAIEGATPLFSDMEELYRLLKSAAQAEAEE